MPKFLDGPGKSHGPTESAFMYNLLRNPSCSGFSFIMISGMITLGLAERLFAFSHFASVGALNVLLLCPKTASGVHVSVAYAVSCCSTPGDLLSTATAGVFVSAPTGWLRVSASAPDVPRSNSWPSLLLSATNSQDPVIEQILSVFLNRFHES